MKLRWFSSAALIALSFICLLASAAAATPDRTDRCLPPRSRSLTAELDSAPGEEVDVYLVPAGTSFVVTDIIALRDGNADGLLRLLGGQQVMAIIPLVGIVSHTDVYGVHLVTGIPFPGGQTIRLKKTARGVAWVTLVGYEVPAP